MELVLRMYNARPYFFLHEFGQKITHYTKQNMVTFSGLQFPAME